MIQMKTFLKAIDNSGALVVECINVIGKKRIATVGDEIVVSVKQAKPMLNIKLKKGDVLRALVCRTKSRVMRNDGCYIQFGDNACVLLNKQGQPIGSRIIGPIAAECRQKRWAKVASLATRVI